MENLLIISIKSVILTKNKNNNPSQIRIWAEWSLGKVPKTRINTGFS